VNQTEQLVDALKGALRSRGVTYRDVAAQLGISEASVKRIFSEKSFTLRRLEDICRLLDTNVYELARQTPMRRESPPRELSNAQEQALADDPVLLTYFYLLITGWKAQRIARRFGLDPASNERCLDALSDLGLVHRLPRNRLRLTTGRRINWRRDGPVRRLYEARVKAEFLHSRFASSDETMRLESGELSDASVRMLQRRIDRLAAEFEDRAEADVDLPATQKRAYAMLLAFRPWTFWGLVEEVRGQSP